MRENSDECLACVQDNISTPKSMTVETHLSSHTCEKGVWVDSTCGMSQHCTVAANKLTWSNAALMDGNRTFRLWFVFSMMYFYVKQTTPRVPSLVLELSLRETQATWSSVGEEWPSCKGTGNYPEGIEMFYLENGKLMWNVGTVFNDIISCPVKEGFHLFCYHLWLNQDQQWKL